MSFLGGLMMLAAAVAPAVASDPSLACNKWQRNLMVKGDFLKEIEQPDAHWCRKQCMMHEGCEASTFLKTGRRQGKCTLFKLNERSMLKKMDSATSWIPCGECNKREEHVEVGGGRVLDSFQIKDFWWCRKKCMMNGTCNAFTFRSKQCTLMDVDPGFLTRERKSGTHSMVMCNKYGVLPICGVKDGPLCDGPEQCEDGLRSSHENKCVCGGMWEPCCDGDCDNGMACDFNSGEFGQCAPCGGSPDQDYQTCCPGNTCNQDDKRRTCMEWGQCAPCGEQYQAPCSEGRPCAHGLEPDRHGKQCVRGKW